MNTNAPFPDTHDALAPFELVGDVLVRVLKDLAVSLEVSGADQSPRDA